MLSQLDTGADCAQLKDELIRLRIVSPEDWATAAINASQDPEAVIRRLQALPARWSEQMTLQCPALTKYQASAIRETGPHILRLEHYVLLEPLGAGVTGEVFKARNLSLPRIEALKRLKTDHCYAGAEARFRREVQILSQLRGPFFTTIHYASESQGSVFFAMEFVEGRNLRQTVLEAQDSGRLIPVRTAVRWTVAVAEALGAAHQGGVIHRDIKPENVFITQAGDVKVLDWGFARLAAQGIPLLSPLTLTAEATAIGSPEVMPVEQWADGHAVTPAADIYSLGCTFFFVLTGRMPFVGNHPELMRAHAYEPPPVPSNMRFEIPCELDRIVLRMLAKDPSERYTGAAALLADLRSF